MSSPRIVTAWLWIDCGQQSRTGTWLRYPTADYRCARCGFTDSASGDQVPGFVRTIRRIHRAACPATIREDTTTR